MNILERIVTQRREDLAETLRQVPLSELEKGLASAPPPRDFASALNGDKVRLIAELKKASPSKGLLAPYYDPPSLAATYAQSGAAALSVLTEPHFFQGSLEHLAQARKAVELPLLRKDFLFDPYQVYEARCWGADAILLIAAILEKPLLAELLGLARSLGMEALVETHNEAEVERAVAAGARVIGINNRDLATFATDLAVTERLRPLVPQDRLVVSESGIHSRADVERLARCGVNAILVGEALMTAPSVAEKVKELI